MRRVRIPRCEADGAYELLAVGFMPALTENRWWRSRCALIVAGYQLSYFEMQIFELVELACKETTLKLLLEQNVMESPFC